MLLPPEAFTHVPALAGKILPPEQSQFRRTRERLAELDRSARESGLPPTWRLSDEEREATRRHILDSHTGDLWLFAYGSLMWDPGVEIAEIRIGAVTGYHRRFCLKSEIGRGSVERPALMAGLDLGGSCQGLAFRIPAASIERETELLWMREMIAGAYAPAMVPVETPQGPVRALTFLMNRSSLRYVRLEPEETARLIATGRGVRGTCREYLENLIDRLELLGLTDPELIELQARVRELARAEASAPTSL